MAKQESRDGSTPYERFLKDVSPAMETLLIAREYSQLVDCDLWEFAVEIQQLTSLGLCSNDLRLLVRLRYVEHASEVTVVGQNGREFKPTGDLTFTDRTCFVLTAEGAAKARRPTKAPGGNGSPPPMALLRRFENAPVRLVPVWDVQKRVLSFDGQVVRHFKWHASNQEMVLAAFQEEDWPSRIDDPLPPQEGQDSKRRLRDTIKCLNRKRRSKAIFFRADGTGEGVVWELTPQTNLSGNGALHRDHSSEVAK